MQYVQQHWQVNKIVKETVYCMSSDNKRVWYVFNDNRYVYVSVIYIEYISDQRRTLISKWFRYY